MIHNEQGQYITDRTRIDMVFNDYFMQLFQSSNPSLAQIANYLNSISLKVNSKLNAQLQRQFTRDEISVSLKQMAPLKAPSPNGFSACFYQL